MVGDELYLLFAALPFLNCLWWAVTIAVDSVTRRKPFSAVLPFLVFVCVSTLLYFCHFIHFTAFGRPLVGVFDSIWVFCTLSVYPLFGLWVRKLTRPSSGKTWAGYIPAILPGLLLSGASFLHLYLGLDQGLLQLLVKFVFTAEVVAVLVSGIRNLRIFRSEVANYYSDTDGKELKPVWTMLALLLLTSAISLVFNTIGRNLFNGSLLLVIPSCIFTVLLYSICHIGHKPVFDIIDFEEELADGSSLDEEGGMPVAPDAQDVLMGKIIKAMQEGELYKKQGLKVSELAAEVGSNRTYVSNCINRKFGLSFSDFVGSYRVKAAKAVMESGHDGKTLEEIGLECGFSSRSQFYRSFKKETGVSPGSFEKK